MAGRRPTVAVVALAAALACATSAVAAGEARVAALQVGLRAKGLYAGTIDGVLGPATLDAVRALQKRAGLPVDGVVGPKTRRALGRFGRHELGSRPLASGKVGWDVAALQYKLAWHGFPSGDFDGHFAARTDRALRRFQGWAGLGRDGVAGPGVLAALARPLPRSPLALARPVGVAATDGFGPRGTRFHTGLDFPAAAGTPVTAARAGRVKFASWHAGGFGYLVTIDHGRGVRTVYAHLSRIDVRRRQRVAQGTQIGLVGSTGHSTGPHLHFEVRVRGASTDPLTALR